MFDVLTRTLAKMNACTSLIHQRHQVRGGANHRSVQAMVTNRDEVEVSIAERDWDEQKAAEAEEMVAWHEQECSGRDAWETSEYEDHVQAMPTDEDAVEVSTAERDWDVQKAAEAEAEMIARHEKECSGRDAWETSEYAGHVTK